MLYPVPKQAQITGEITLPENASVGFRCEPGLDGDKFRIVFGYAADADGAFVGIYARCAPPDLTENAEAFTLAVTRERDGVRIRINCLTDAALVRALFRIGDMLRGGRLPLGRLTDHPSFARRGYIEGFYGRPWTHTQRLDMIGFAASRGENCVYYAPKDDPYHRRRWRDPYPAAELDKLRELSDKAADLCMTFTYCIAPGLSIRYTDASDTDCLHEKLRQLYEAGIRSFGLLLDDIPDGFSCPGDEAKYPDFVSAHIDLVNDCYRFLRSLDAQCALTVCPTVYWGRGDDEYDVRLGNAVPEDVLLFFTGRDICSREITLAEAEYFRRHTAHAPLYWDNYPVNDAEMFKEMHFAPVNGRAPDLYRASAGVISNCMEYYECTKFPLYTVADYLWAPETYDPEISFDRALNALLPEDEVGDMRLLADHLRTSCLRDENSRIMGGYLGKATAFIASGERERAIPFAEEYILSVCAAARRLAGRQGAVYRELGEWTEKFTMMCGLLADSLTILKDAADDPVGAKRELARKMNVYNDRATVLTAFCFREYIETLLGTDDPAAL